jgi:membrane-bound serine protease (ClpP class)
MNVSRRNWFTALLVLMLGTWASAQPTTAPATAPAVPGAGTRVVVIPVEGMIDEFVRDTLRQRVQRAREMGATTIILKINTYGGLVTAGLDISRFLKQQSDLHTIAYINEKAISAGALIAVACNEIVMEPHAMIGDSGVIRSDGQELTGTMQAKAESPVIEDFYDSAMRNGHPELLLRGMVVTDLVIHYIENPQTGERRFVEDKQYDKLTAQGWVPVPGVRDPLDTAGTLVTLNTDLAITLGLAEGKYATVEDFAASRGYEVLATLNPNFNERVVGFLSSLAVRGILLSVFMFAIYMAFSTPGHGAPEALAMVALAALLGVPYLTGYAQWYEIVAVLLGVALLAVEIFVLPGFGVAGITGLLLVLGGLTMTFVPPIDMPALPRSWGGGFPWAAVREGLMVTLGGMIGSLLLWWWLSRYLPKLPYFGGLVLNTTVGSTIEPDAAPTPANAWPALGARGTVVTDLRPGGTASFDDPTIGERRVTDVVTDRGFVPAGTDVVVRQIEGSRVVVRPISESNRGL